MEQFEIGVYELIKNLKTLNSCVVFVLNKIEKDKMKRYVIL